ncbi:hypothetical protein KAH94_04630, partial [bacterium]|nr:hypothetical protein [bacterium]
MQRLKNLFGKENIKIYQIPKEKSFKIEIDLIGVKNGDKYKVDLDFALSIIGKPNLKNIAKKSIDG